MSLQTVKEQKCLNDELLKSSNPTIRPFNIRRKFRSKVKGSIYSFSAFSKDGHSMDFFYSQVDVETNVPLEEYSSFNRGLKKSTPRFVIDHRGTSPPKFKLLSPEIQIQDDIRVFQAAYGDFEKQETRIDENVRKGWVIPSSEFYLDPKMKEHIQKCILDHAGLHVKLLEHSINIYDTGSHFLPHVDTPRHDAARMIGTVVILLYNGLGNGGKFFLKKKEQEMRRDDFIFFFGDQEHSVSRLESGFRVTMTLDVLLEGHVFSDTLADERLFTPWLKDEFLIILKKTYTMAALRQGVMQNETDIQILESLKKLDLPYEFVQVVASEDRIAHHNKFYSDYIRSLNLPDRDEYFEGSEGNEGSEGSEEENTTKGIHDREFAFNDVGANLDPEKALEYEHEKCEFEPMIVRNQISIFWSSLDSDTLVPATRVFGLGNEFELLSRTFSAEEFYFYMGNQHDPGIETRSKQVYLTAGILVNAQPKE